MKTNDKKLIQNALKCSKRGDGNSFRKLINSVLYSKVRNALKLKEKLIAKNIFKDIKEK